ncbi:unnamed protein product, partial [Heterosigma akashiwo]
MNRLSKRLPGLKIEEDRQVCLMEIISADLTGPFSARSVTGNRYVLVLIEHYSDYCWIYPLKIKSQATAHIMTLFELLNNQLGTYPNKFRTDRGGEFYNDELQSFLSSKGIIAESGPASTPEYNMKQERKQLFLETMANAQLDASPLTKGYWDLSWVVAVYVSNRLPAHKNKGFLTRFELLWNKRPNVSHMRPFGCVGYCALSSPKRKKMNPKAVKAIMVGYAEDRKAYLMLTSQTKKFIVSRDVNFAEGPYAQQCLEKVHDEIFEQEDLEDIHAASKEEEKELLLIDDTLDIGGEEELDDNLITTPNEWADPLNTTTGNDTNDPVDDLLINKYDTDQRFLVYTEAGPSIYKALNSPEKSEWIQALQKEWTSFDENEVYDIVPREEAGTNKIFKVVIVLVKKISDNGDVLYKARCCVSGNYIDYEVSTYAPVVDAESSKLLTAVCMQAGMCMTDFDISTAYLNGKLKEPRFMEIPIGVLPNVSHKNFILKLKRAVYGLPEAGNIWNSTFDKKVTNEELRFKKCVSSPALYARIEGEDRAYMGLSTDDVKLFTTSLALKEEILSNLSKHFKIKVLGVASEFLGI